MITHNAHTAKAHTSIVVPSRNSAPWIEELLESILMQRLDSFEVLVIDNGSSDNTAELVTRVAARDARVRLIRLGPASAAAARNEGVAEASGEYLVFADSDDIVPDGAYRAMLESLETSGSDMVIGDHLKFSATATWSPTKRWYSFDSARLGAAPDDVPALLSGRACWNRMFRRSFWDRAGLRFPEIPSVDDIEPMTRAFVAARAVDVVPDCVYLYRDRGDRSSLSRGADTETMLRYIDQERQCAELVQDRPVLRAAHAEVVLDADGWAHLSRFVVTEPDVLALEAVSESLSSLLSLLPEAALERVAPVRRVLWELVLRERWKEAAAFVRGTQSARAADRLGAWADAALAIRGADGDEPQACAWLLTDGLLPAVINDAEAVPERWLADRLVALRTLPFEGTTPGLRVAMADAIGRGDEAQVRLVSRLRRAVPLVVDRADASVDGLDISGSLPGDLTSPGLELLVRSESASVRLPIDVQSGRVLTDGDRRRWRAHVPAAALRVGRQRVSVIVQGLSGEFPVVTARMPLPPLGTEFPLQPLADRADGWRFLIDRRDPRRRGFAGLITRIGRRLR